MEEKKHIKPEKTVKKEKKNKPEKDSIKNKKRKVIIAIIILAILLIALIAIIGNIDNIKSITNKMLAAGENNTSEVSQVNEEIGKEGIISAAQIKKTQTGTGPFDSDDEAGNDSSETNNIVRSFDQITWTVDLTLALKSGSTQTNLKGGTIDVEVELPRELANLVEWDTSSMSWMTNTQVSEDGRTLTGQYTMSEGEVTIPGKQTLEIVLQVYGAGNREEITPTFKFGIAGNEENEKVEITGDTIYVSATGKYNIQLASHTNYLNNKATVDYGEGNTLGRMYGYGFAIQLYNDSVEKGLKGLEYPKGEISFDIDLKLERTKAGSTQREDITNECTPILWNYRVNDWTNNKIGNIADREMYSINYNQLFVLSLPLGIKNTAYPSAPGNKDDYGVYNSGNIEITQQGSKLKVTVKDYDFNGIFPLYEASYWSDSARDKIYDENVGTFSVGYVQIFVPDNEASTMEDRTYYFSINDSNMKVTTRTNEEITTQMKTSDDSQSRQHLINKPGSYRHILQVFNKNRGLNTVESHYGEGDGRANIGETIRIEASFRLDITNEYDAYSGNKFIKFDGDGFEPVYFDDGSKYITRGMNGNAEFRVWYTTKKDGTNWTSQAEMSNANIEDMDIYDNIEDIPSNKICVGMYFETISGYLSVVSSENSVNILVRIKDTAVIGETYGITQRTQIWKEQLDRNKYSILHPENEYPKCDWDSGNREYIKTEYDEEGNMVEGTHTGTYGNYGNTVLVVGANLHGNISAVDENGAEKTTYDLGKNENRATFKVEPKLDRNANLSVQIGGVRLKVKVTIPKGLEYIEQSSNYGDPEITKNSDGSQTLIWYIEGCVAGSTIEPITFEAQIDNETANETQYTATFVVSEDVQNDTPKIGNSEINYRTSTTTINIVNLASHRLYKEVSETTVENNKEITYKIVYENKTEESVPEFQLLDIMPYNGDSRGSRYTGSYTVEGIKIKQTINGEEQGNTNIKLYTTASEEVRGINAKDEGIGSSSIWEEKTISNGSSQISEEITGIALKGEVRGKERIEIEITIKPNGNKSKDIYVNNAMAQITKDSEQMETGTVETIIVERQLQEEIEVTTTITVKDRMSEVVEVEYGWSESDKTGPSKYTKAEGNLTDPIRVSAKLTKGTHYLWVIATDGVGNVSQEISKVFVVKEPTGI